MNNSDLKLGEETILNELILLENDPVFYASSRPSLDEAVSMILGTANGYQVPFAAVPFAHHAGLPEQNLFRCLFGRDSLVISGLLNYRNPDLVGNVVKALAISQGINSHPLSEEEPGRIPHEIREKNDPRAIDLEKNGNWRFPYYGTVDATLLWIKAVSQLSSKDESELDVSIGGMLLWHRVSLATGWILQRLDNHLGLMISLRSNPTGIENQVWKDSGDSYMHADGSLPSDPIASIETVGECYDALLAAATIQELRPSPRWPLTSAELRERARVLQEKLIEYFWLEDHFALGVECLAAGGYRALDSMASNQGRLLDSAILDGKRFAPYRQAIASSLTSSELLGETGLRTLATSHPSYRPGGYHTGSAWPMDGVLAARGLRRHGFDSEALLVITKIKNAIEAIGGYPEFFRGDAPSQGLITSRIIDVIDQTGRGNRVCQPPQLIQGWTVGAYAWIVNSLKTETDG